MLVCLFLALIIAALARQMVQHRNRRVVINAGQATNWVLGPIPCCRRAEKHVIEGRLAQGIRQLREMGQGDNCRSQFASTRRLLLLVKGQFLRLFFEAARGLHFVIVEPMTVILVVDRDR